MWLIANGWGRRVSKDGVLSRALLLLGSLGALRACRSLKGACILIWQLQEPHARTRSVSSPPADFYFFMFVWSGKITARMWDRDKGRGNLALFQQKEKIKKTWRMLFVERLGLQ